MSPWLSIPIIALTLVLASGGAFAQSVSLKGVWRIVEIVDVEGQVDVSPHPGLYIFTDRYYSIQWVTAPRTASPDNPSDKDKLAAWTPFIANSGTYELKGNALSTRPLVAKNPNVMTGSGGTAELRFEGGNTVYLTSTNPTGATIKLQRVE